MKKTHHFTERSLKAANYPRPKANDNLWIDGRWSHEVFCQDCEEGSEKLLRALWREHPRILRHHFYAGRKVERPGSQAA